MPVAKRVTCSADMLTVTLGDGRKISVPLSWYPRLEHGTATERRRWKLLGRGAAIHWPDLDEDLSVEGLIAGRTSRESRTSLARWLSARRARR